MTSIARDGGREASVPAFAATVGRHFGEVFERDPRAVTLDSVGVDRQPARLGGD
jgi:hypothetical protein